MRKTFFFVIAIVVAAQAGLAQSRYSLQEKETIRRSLEFTGSNHVFELDNINGSIRVTANTGRAVEVVGEKTIRADSADRMEAAKREVTIDIADRAETVHVFVDSPDNNNRSNSPRTWDYNNRRRGPGYHVNIDFDIKVPNGTKIRLRTINGGEINVDGTTGDFEVENVNGKITMTDIRGSGRAHTVNGAVRVSFMENPKTESSFKTTNGAIEVQFQPNLSANLQMKTYNGGLYSDFDVQYLPATALVPGERTVSGKYVYRSNQFTGFKVGNGGPEIKFDGFNGDVKVLRRTR
jgi:hypothetical protein